MRKLKSLESIISVTIASPHQYEKGYAFASVDDFPGSEVDPLYDSSYIEDLYLRADPDYTGKCTVPVLWDKILHTIVNNDASDIMRIFNFAFNGLLPENKAALDFYPAHISPEIDDFSEWADGVMIEGAHKTGLATTFEKYRCVVVPLFEALDRVERMLKDKTYLIGDRLTAADISLYTTLIRFDPVYVDLFKCNLKTIRHGYPNIHLWLRRLYWCNDAFQSTTDFNHIKIGYYSSWMEINPHCIVPIGPVPHIEPLR
ncbi:glutathione S-transferase [Heterobasidion irregulare TC 32-1]|uniref:Glutathione S-transferase n=1 Tax=Heterobasidion irregulare (strain TC 32-1) TaxID=747525 RepID=W4JWN7_HETIT|nr:glutathione S-transferase [Heterobasidion irregulare TC 32-1]ETW77983.1 glutathione S-transferase [Heterobasidion irregulare TC 32-1]